MAVSRTKKRTSRPADVRPAKSSHLHNASSFEEILKQAGSVDMYVLCLYITGTTPRSTAAIANVRALCEEHLRGRYELEVVDIYQQPHKAVGEQIIAVPTLVKSLPAPPRRIIGTMSDQEKVLIGLNLKPKSAASAANLTHWVEI